MIVPDGTPRGAASHLVDILFAYRCPIKRTHKEKYTYRLLCPILCNFKNET